MASKKETETKERKAQKCVDFCVKLIDTWEKYSRQRLMQIRDMEKAYYNDVRPVLSTRSNVPVPVFAKYVDELKGRLDDLPALKFDNHRLSQSIVQKKVQSAIDQFKKPERGDWARLDRMQRVLAIFSGYGVTDWMGETDNDGRLIITPEPVDHNEFVFEPMGGSNLENHIAVGKFPVFRTKEQLEARVSDGIYDAEQVKKLILRGGTTDTKKNDQYFQSRYDRYKSLGLDVENNNYIGQQSFALAVMQVTYEGERVLVVFDYQTATWLRFEPLKKVYGSNLYTMTLWQTHEDPNVVMCKSPADNIYPLSELFRVKVNQLVDSNTKRVWGQRAYDANFFPYPEQLEWQRPDQIITARSYQGKPISSGIHEFRTEDMTGSMIEFFNWLDKFLASVVGIDPEAVSNERERVGVLFGQLGKAGARLGIFNKSYKEAWQKGGYRALHLIKHLMDEPMMVEMIGSKGLEWQKFSKDELGSPSDFEISAEGANVELEMNEAKKERQEKVLAEISKDPLLAKEVNPRWRLEQLLRIADFNEEQIRKAMDLKTYGSEDMLARADLAVEQIAKGKKPKIYKGADLSFFEYIYTKAQEMDDEDEKEAKIKTELLQYGMAHRAVVIENMANKAVEEIAKAGITPDKIAPQQPQPQQPQQAQGEPQIVPQSNVQPQ